MVACGVPLIWSHRPAELTDYGKHPALLMSETTATLSGLTVEQVSAVLTQPLERAAKFLTAGPMIHTSPGPLRIPRAPAFDLSSMAWTAEGGAIPDNVQATGGQVTLLPTTLRSLKVITRFTSELARQSVTSIDAALRASLVRAVATKLDAQLFSTSDGMDTGVKVMPAGMFGWAGTQSVPVGGPITPDHILDGIALALAANVDVERLRFFVRSSDFVHLRKLKDTTDRYILDPTAQAGAVGSINGIPVIVTDAIPAGYAALADMSQVAVARDVDASVTLLSETYAATDELGIRVVTRYDAAPVNPPAVIKFTGITDPAPGP